MYERTYVCMYACMQVCVYVCMVVWSYGTMFACVCMYVHLVLTVLFVVSVQYLSLIDVHT